ncbi:MAG: ABC transporter ATP-binding protein [Anaerolineales bacterium]|nr:ABC transporter ATP-binding protein [Anaerolineales bacterium]
MAVDAAIVSQSLTRRFGEIVAVDHLDLEIRRGEVFGCLGHNGAGKTTTVRLLNGVLAPHAGTMRVLGMDPVSQGATLRQRTGVLTETPSLDERLSARECLAIYAELYLVPPAQIGHRIDELLSLFELTERADEKVAGYSKGMKQRLALIRAILHDPEILFLDEPTSGLDPLTTVNVHEMIRDLSQKEGRTVFLCTHNLVEAQRLCDRVAVLAQGRLIAVGAPSELVRQAAGTAVVDIEVAAGQAARCAEIVQRLPRVSAVQQRDDSLSVAGLGRDAVPELVQTLVAQGISIYRVASQEPSLEDVYFALQRGR